MIRSRIAAATPAQKLTGRPIVGRPANHRPRCFRYSSPRALPRTGIITVEAVPLSVTTVIVFA
jgi:hypothetical protein